MTDEAEPRLVPAQLAPTLTLKTTETLTMYAPPDALLFSFTLDLHLSDQAGVCCTIMATTNGSTEPSYFEQQRALLIQDVAAVSWTTSHFLLQCPVTDLCARAWKTSYRTSISSTEASKGSLPYGPQICVHWTVALTFNQVGNEFSQVEGLWSQFENVMAKDDTNKDTKHDKSREERR